MLEYLRSLYRYQSWADDELLKAVAAFEPAQTDPEMLHALHHMVNVRFYLLSQMKNEGFDAASFQEQPSFPVLRERFLKARAAEEAFLNSLSESELGRPYEMQYFRSNFTRLEGITQTILHSQNHRGQCLTRLRELGPKPPTVDYILWVKDHCARPDSN